jgi:hypothetical protein
MQTIIAKANLQFVNQSRLFEAIYKEESTNFQTVRLPYAGAPTPFAQHTSLTDDVAHAAVTINYTDVVPLPFPKRTHANKGAIFGSTGLVNTLSMEIGNHIVASVDKHIAAVATTENFTATPISDCVTIGAFEEAIATLMNTGYFGEMACFMTYPMRRKIMESARLVNLPMFNDRWVTSGYSGDLSGVPIFPLPSSWVPQTSSKATGLLFFRQFGIGAGFYAGDGSTPSSLIHPHYNPAPQLYDEVGGTAWLTAGKMAATGGILLLSDEAEV